MTATDQHVDHQLLRLYLKDHLTGSTAGVQRIRRMARAYADTPLGTPLSELAREIAEGREHLLQVMDRLHMRPGRLRNAIAAIGELLGRLKLNGRFIRQSPTSPLLETELMRSAVIGQRGLWQTLTTLAEELSLNRADYEALTATTTRLLESLDQIHIIVRTVAFTDGGI